MAEHKGRGIIVGTKVPTIYYRIDKKLPKNINKIAELAKTYGSVVIEASPPRKTLPLAEK